VLQQLQAAVAVVVGLFAQAHVIACCGMDCAKMVCGAMGQGAGVLPTIKKVLAALFTGYVIHVIQPDRPTGNTAAVFLQDTIHGTTYTV
jgi:uncharacterized membrane protein